MYDKRSFFLLYISRSLSSSSVSVPMLSSRNLPLVFCTGSSGDYKNKFIPQLRFIFFVTYLYFSLDRTCSFLKVKEVNIIFRIVRTVNSLGFFPKGGSVELLPIYPFLLNSPPQERHLLHAIGD